MKGWHIEDFIKYIRFEKRYALNTCTAYEHDLLIFQKFMESTFEVHQASDVSPEFIRTWIYSFISDKKAIITIHRKISSVKSYFKFLQRNKWVTKNPLLSIILPKKPKRLPVFVDETKMKQLQLQQTDSKLSTYSLLLHKLIMELFYQTGVRRSELVNLVEKNIDLYSSQIKVLGKRNKERIIPIGEDLKAIILNYRIEKDKRNMASDYLLYREDGKRVTDKWVYLLVNRELSLVSTLKKKSPHVLRHSFATHLLDHGAEITAVKDLLGHSSLAATQVYTHNTLKKLKATYNRAHPRA